MPSNRPHVGWTSEAPSDSRQHPAQSAADLNDTCRTAAFGLVQPTVDKISDLGN
jgi:hypothetical protein